jgi:hypothetical protein
LSRSGFDVARVDHVGIDIIASNPHSGERMGITVKSRTRIPGREDKSVTFFKTKNNDREKLSVACKAFGCVPWIAIYSEGTLRGDLYLFSLKCYDARYRSQKRTTTDVWQVKEKYQQQYALDPEVRHIRIDFAGHWPAPG